MKLSNFIEKLELAYKCKTQYKSGGWGSHKDNLWYFDCICLVKAILWGWRAEIKEKHGGASYKSNGVPDYNDTKFFNLCHNISTDFSNVPVGAMVWLKGHVGIYVGEGKVIEATTGWGKKKVVKSSISKTGVRSLNGVKCLKWTKWGLIPFVDYGDTPTPSIYNLTRLLKKGCKGDDVKHLQETLISLGYSCGKYGADGVFGNDTLKAVKKFQKAKGLTQDGIVGHNTAKALGWLYNGK